MNQEKESAAVEAWEAYLAEQKLIIGMPGLLPRPSFIAGYLAALQSRQDRDSQPETQGHIPGH